MAARRSRKTPKKSPAPKSGGHTALVIVLLACAAVVAYLGYAGLFSTVAVTEAEAGPFALMLQTQKGDYRQTPVTIEAVRRSADSVGIVSEAGCGIFLDNPKVVPTEKLRAQVGLVISPADKAKVRRLPAAISYKLVAREKCLTVEFPFRTKLAAMIGYMRVYPVLMAEAKARNLETDRTVEIYRMGESITYLIPVVPAKAAPKSK
jgi:hypothetical protein